MKKIIYENKFEVNSFVVDSSKNLSLFGLLGFLQDSASMHANQLGVGYNDMIMKDQIWVIIDQILKVKRWPRWQDEVLIKTWPRKLQGLRTYRDFEIYIGEEKVGESVTSFMVLDVKTRKSKKLELNEKFLEVCRPESLSFVPEKIDISVGMESVDNIRVRHSDIDMNQHVNNAVYSRWVIDALAARGPHQTLKEYKVNFLAEVKLGDSVQIQKSKVCEGGKSFYVNGIRKSDGKVIFQTHLTFCKNR